MSLSTGVVLATGGYDNIRFWDVACGQSVRQIAFGDSQVNTLAISPDKLHLLAGGNPKLKLFETNTNNLNSVVEFEGHTNNVTSCGFQKKGKWVFSGSEDGTIRIFDRRTAYVQRMYESPSKASVNSVVLHPNQSQLVSANNDGYIRVWDLVMDRCIASTKPVKNEDIPMRCVSVASNGSVVAACNNVGILFLWKMDSAQTCASLDRHPDLMTTAHESYCLKCVISPDRKLVATASADRTVKLWKLPSLELDKTFAKHDQWVHDIAFSADSSFLVSASSDNSARLWDVSSGEMIKHYNQHSKAVVAVALNDSSFD